MKSLILLTKSFFPAFLLLLTNNIYAQLKAGDKAPALTITNWIQNEPATKSLKGKLLVVDFWATWCAPCLGSVPHFNELIEANKKNNKLVFLSISDEKESKIRKLLPKVHFSSAVVADSTGKTFADYGIQTIPYCVLIDDKMRVKWSGTAKDLTADIIKQFAAGKEIVAAATLPASGEEKPFYDSVKKEYRLVFNDKEIKEYFNMAPLMNKPGNMQTNMKGPTILNEIVMGKSLPDAIARLQEVSSTQIVLSPAMSQTFISYCYKSTTKVNYTDLLDIIVQQLDLHVTTKDSLQDVITLEVTDTSKLYADLPGSNDNTSKISTDDDGKFISIMNNTLPALVNPLQDRFSCIIMVKDAAQYPRRINMTVMSDDFAKFTESMASYGIKATRAKQPVKIYYYE